MYVFLWTAEEGKTLLTPRHSLNAFSEPRPSRTLGTGGSQQKLTTYVACISVPRRKGVQQLISASPYAESEQLSRLTSQCNSLLAIFVGKACSATSNELRFYEDIQWVPIGKQYPALWHLSLYLAACHHEVASIPLGEVSRESCSVST